MFDWINSDAWLAWLPEMKAGLRILAIVIGAWVAQWLLGRLIIRMRMRFVARASSPDAARWMTTLARVLRYSLKVLVVVLAVMLVLNELGVSIAPLLGAAGVVGIALGFGAQSLIKDYFNGFFLLIENQIRVGDVVKIADKAGFVEEVSLRRVRLRDYDGSVHYVPNGMIGTVTNMSTQFAYALMDIGIAYGANIDDAITAIRDVARELRASSEHSARIIDDIDIAGVENWADSSIVIRCRIKVLPLEQWTIKRQFLKRLKERFDRDGIEIPFPYRTVVFKNAPQPEQPAGGREQAQNPDQIRV